jgi:hypothetical protein
MNSTEREQLSQFLQQLVQAQAGPKDVEAESLISRAMAQQPDAAYLLVQRALLQDAGLKLAQQQAAALQEEVAQLKQQATPARAAGGFLDANAWGRAPVAGPAAVAPGSIGSQVNQPGLAAAAPYAAQAPVSAAFQPAPAQPAPAAGFQAPSFLTSMATTAAGVAAGAFLFQGLGHLMGNHQNTGASAFGLSGPQAGNSSDGNTLDHNSQPSEVINNYFESPTAAGASADRGDDRWLDTSAASADDFDSAGLDADPSSDDWA